MMEQKKEMLPIKAHYRFDQFLLHLVQDVTKKPTADVLNFFYELTQQICQISMEKRKGSGVRKVFHDYFPGTSIPFHMLIVGHTNYDRGQWNPHTRVYEHPDKRVFSCDVEIGFPASRTYMDAKKLEDMQSAIMEQQLLGAEVVPLAPFDKPPIKNPKMFKKFMDEVLGRPVEDKPKKPRKKRVAVAAPQAPAPQPIAVQTIGLDQLLAQILGAVPKV